MNNEIKCRCCRCYDTYDGCTAWSCESDYKLSFDRLKEVAKSEGVSPSDIMAYIVSEGEKMSECDGCKHCLEGEPIPTDGGGELEIVQLIPLPAINLTTGETDKTAKPPYWAIQFKAFEDELTDCVPIRYCPICGKPLTMSEGEKM